MRSLVVNPPEFDCGWYPATAPLGLALAAGALQAAGSQVQVLDLAVQRGTLAQVEEWLQASEADLVYTAGSNEQCDWVRWLSRLQAESRPQVPFLIGGPVVLSLREELLERSLAHALVVGEPEPTLQEAAATLAGGGTLGGVPGLLVRGEQAAARAPVPLAGLPGAAWELFPVQAYLARCYRRGGRSVSQALPLLVGRGCPQHCPHCLCEEGVEARFRPTAEVLAEADALAGRLGVRHLMLRGLLAPCQAEVLEPLLAGLRERPHLTWELRTRADLVAPAQVAQLRAAGCICIEYEPELLGEGELDPGRRERMVAALRAHRQAGLACSLPRLLAEYQDEPPPLDPELAELLSEAASAPVPLHYWPGTLAHRQWIESCTVPAWPPRLEFHSFKRPGWEESWQAALDPAQAAEWRYRARVLAPRALPLPSLGEAPRVVVVGAARPRSIAGAVEALEAQYPQAQVLMAVSPATRASLAYCAAPRWQMVDHGAGPRALLREVRAFHPTLAVVASDETSGLYSKAKLLALLSGARQWLVYDGVSGGFLSFAGELERDCRRRLGSQAPALPADPRQDPAWAVRSPVSVIATDRVFPEVAPETDRLQHLARYQFASQFVDEGDRVLDCGCTSGYGAQLLAQRGAQVHGADPSAELVRYARWRYPELEAQLVGGSKLPYPDDHFQVVVCFRTLERVAEPEALVAEMARVLAPGGILVAAVAWRPQAAVSVSWRARDYTPEEFTALLSQHFRVHDLVPQVHGEVDWRLPLGNFLVAQCDVAKPRATPSPRWWRYRPLVSVIMPTWNPGHYLEEALESIFNQTFQDFEFVIVDNGSTDGTRERLQALHEQGKIRLIASAENLGISRGLDVALIHSQGKYIARMDGDDRSRPERLARQVEYLEQHPDVYLVGTAACIIDGEGKETGEYYPIATSYQAILAALPERCPIQHGSVMFRRSLLREVGMYDPDNTGGDEDYDYWIRISRQHKVAALDEVLFEYRRHGGQLTQARQRRHCAWVDTVQWLYFPRG